MARPSLAALEAFAAVAASRNFNRAAGLLGVSRSGLSHTVAGLERALGVRLLHRTTRSVAPTEAGARLLQRLGPALRDLDAALDTLAEGGGEVAGPLRINAAPRAASLLLRDTVPRFVARHPRVELDLVTDGRLVDIVAAGFDAGIRLREAVPLDTVAIPSGGPVRFVAVASPAYLATAAAPAPATPDDLARHRCVRQRLPSGRRYRWEFARDGQELAIDPPGPLTLDEPALMVEAAVAGLGIAYVLEEAAAAALADGRLVRVLAAWCPPSDGLALYTPANRHQPAALRAFIAVLSETEAERSPMPGRRPVTR